MNGKNVERVRTIQQNMIYNTVGSLIYFASQWLLSVLIVRLSGFEDAGLLALAMSATAAPAIIGLFNIRNFQVSDLEGQYTDKEYIRSRIYTNIFSVFVCLLIVLFYGYSGNRALIILTFMAFKVVEGMADAYYGIEQKNQRMDYSGVSLSVRGIGGLILFYGVFWITKNLVISIVAMTLFSLIVILYYDRVRVRYWQMEGKVEKRRVISLLVTCLPLAIVAFLNNLSIMLPRLYLEQYHGEKIMGIYSSVASPTLVVNLAAGTLFAPMIPALTAKYKQGNRKAFLRDLRRFAILIGLITIAAIVSSKLLGRWGLVLLFGTEIEPYVYLFVPVILISILIAVNASMFSICTLMRAIKSQYVIGIFGIVGAIVTSLTLVKAYSMVGVVVALAITLSIQIMIQLIIICRKVGRIKQ